MAARHPGRAIAISEAILASPLTRAEIGKRTGAKQSTVSRWAGAQAAPERQYWDAIREVFDIDMATIGVPSPSDNRRLDEALKRIDTLERRLERLALILEVSIEEMDVDDEPTPGETDAEPTAVRTGQEPRR